MKVAFRVLVILLWVALFIFQEPFKNLFESTALKHFIHITTLNCCFSLMVLSLNKLGNFRYKLIRANYILVYIFLLFYLSLKAIAWLEGYPIDIIYLLAELSVPGFIILLYQKYLDD